MATRSDSGSSIDLVTVVAIAMVAYPVTNVVHEGIGHGGAALLLGAHPTMFNAMFFNYDDSAVPMDTQRLISAAGSIADVIFGFIALALLPRVRSPRWRYFLWLFAAVNLLVAFGYLMYSGIGGIGDWAHVVKGWRPAWMWRVGLAIIGIALYFVIAPKLLMPSLEPFLGREPAARRKRARVLSLMPYLAGGLVFVLAGMLNPLGVKIMLISAVAASFGGTSLLAWYPALPRPPRADTPETPLGVERSIAWIAAAVVVTLIFVLVLGPGIGRVQR